eukprot:SAG11_NODE_9764_length_882_cov_1.583653_2_plen_77_part_00
MADQGAVRCPAAPSVVLSVTFLPESSPREGRGKADTRRRRRRILHVMADAKAKIQREAAEKKAKEEAIDDEIDMFA